jgi:threonyl-tRNA synthetase
MPFLLFIIMAHVTIQNRGYQTPEPKAGMLIGDVVPVELKKSVIAATVDGRPIDLSEKVPERGEIVFITIDSPDGIEILRHSTSHIMAEAVQSLFPDVKVTIGPAIESGFYYDFDTPRPFEPEDLEKIEKRMGEIIKKNHPFVKKILPIQEAVEYFKGKGETYKIELLSGIQDETVSLYTQGSFTDLCRGPHIPSSGLIKAFKLTSIAGAYWRGDEKNKMLQRVYGTAFPDKESLQQHLTLLEEAKRRDHRKLGRELDLFQFNDDAGAGLPIYHPKGTMLRMIIEDFMKAEHLRRGYDIVMGPVILKQELWERSGHFDNYRENMYFTEVEGQRYGIKPMNCLAHMLIYKSKLRSYRDLPLRYFELGTVHRHEKSGVLHGLLRARAFTQDDAHIICTPEQLIDEIVGVMDFVAYTMEVFGFPYSMELSTRPEKSIGSDEDWERATEALKFALERQKQEYAINEGDGAFYGPKIDFKLRDAIGRQWQCATIQCDFTLPERFDLTYIDSTGEKKRPVMLHRVILGSMDRFLGILIEHYAGAFPVGFAPFQAVVLTITDDHIPFGQDVLERLRSAGLRVRADFRNEKLGLKVREAQVEKIPYTLIIGKSEVAEGTVTPRMLNGKNLDPMKIDEFVEHIKNESSVFWRG